MIAQKSRYGSPDDWSQIISGASKGAETAIQGDNDFANAKGDAKESKRRTLSNLMNNAMKRSRGLFRTGQDYQDEMNDFQSQALQQVARGFVNALQGSTRRS